MVIDKTLFNGKEIVFERIDEKNFKQAQQVFFECFPSCKRTYDYEQALKDPDYATYIIVFLKGEPCGITGYYTYGGNQSEMFMGWFGVAPKFRRLGLGNFIFDWTANKVKSFGCDFFRLCTDIYTSQEALNFYRKKGLYEEKYTNPKGGFLGNCGKAYVFTMPLKNQKVVKWNNRLLNESDEAFK